MSQDRLAQNTSEVEVSFTVTDFVLMLLIQNFNKRLTWTLVYSTYSFLTRSVHASLINVFFVIQVINAFVFNLSQFLSQDWSRRYC